MFVPFEDMPAQSRVWIYPASRQLTGQEIAAAGKMLKEFCEQWKAHGHPLHTSFTISFDRFIILAANEQMASASGCSIDSSVHTIQKIGEFLKIDLFDRTQIPFIKNDKVISYPLSEVKKLMNSGTLTPQDLTFNLLASTKQEWEYKGRITISDSWMSRYLTASV